MINISIHALQCNKGWVLITVLFTVSTDDCLTWYVFVGIWVRVYTFYVYLVFFTIESKTRKRKLWIIFRVSYDWIEHRYIHVTAFPFSYKHMLLQSIWESYVLSKTKIETSSIKIHLNWWSEMNYLVKLVQ